MTAADDAALRRIEEQSLNVTQFAPQILYDGWLLRMMPGKTKRARSVNAFYRSSLDVHRKIRHCERVYADAGLPALFRVTPFDEPRQLDAVLEAEGYARYDETTVMVADAGAAAQAAAPLGADVRALDIPAFCRAVAVIRGSSDEQRALHEARLGHSPIGRRLVVAFDGELPVASGHLAFEGDIAGIYDVLTAGRAQRRGHASALCAELCAWAWTHGMTRLYLQVTRDNAPALGLYRKFAFVPGYSYHYRCRPEEFA